MRSLLRRTAAFAALSAALASACSPLHRGGPPGDRQDAVIVFHNESPDLADVYAIGSSGQAMRIGSVFSGRTATLSIPAGATSGDSRVNIVARIFPSSRIVASGPFSLGPGESMDVTLGSDERILSVLPSREE